MSQAKRRPTISVLAGLAPACAAAALADDIAVPAAPAPPEGQSESLAEVAAAAFLEQMQRERGSEFAMAHVGQAWVVGALVTGDEAGLVSPAHLKMFATAYLNGDISKPESLTLIELACAIMAVMDKAPEAARQEYYDALEDPLGERQEHEPRAVQFRRLVALLHALDEPVAVQVSVAGANLQPVYDYRRHRSRTAFEYFEAHYGDLPREQRPFSDEVRRANYKFWDALRTHLGKSRKSIDELFPIRPEAAGGSIVKLRKSGALARDPAEELARRRAQARAYDQAYRDRKRRKQPVP